MTSKRYRLTSDQIRAIAPGLGACFASEKITVDGNPVRFMYREAAIHDVDSGWRFFSGLETADEMDDAATHGVFDCNTIANFDPSIVAHLDAPVGSVFEKPPGAADFAPVTDWRPSED